MQHYCADAEREMRARERWEFAERGDGTTQVTLHWWRDAPGLTGWLQKLLGNDAEPITRAELRRRLAHVQFTAERQP
jgi:hypothetical protein